ncbi:unnamed protein product [Owenia fusiformis]|uniref:G-protein coupled receptors family 1 profile domain-containing protein n=1 Tax=Owenia fusiformis TaxID=6347 RepID=A0A8S4PWH4_OWEFU|nr:unnamed protein product [Owenia fusiformis]
MPTTDFTSANWLADENEFNRSNVTTSWANYSDDVQPFTESDIYTWFISSTILCVLSTIANTFSILAIKNIPGKLTGNHILYLNLSIADILGSLASNIEVVTLAFVELWLTSFEDVLSAFKGILYFRVIGFACFILFYSVSAWTLLGFAILRYVAICRSMYYPNIYQRRKILIGIAMIWMLALAVSVPTLCLLKLGDPTEDQFCTTVHYVWPIVFAFISLVIIILYVCVYIESKRAMVRANRMHPGQEYPNHQYKAFVTTLLLLATLALSFLPYIIIRILRLSDRDLKLKFAYYRFIYFLPYINFGSDPIIYASRTRDIREGYSRLWKKIVGCCKRCSRRDTKFERLYHILKTQ